MLGELKISFCTEYFLGKIEILNSSTINRNFDLWERKSSTIFENISKIVLYSLQRRFQTFQLVSQVELDELYRMVYDSNGDCFPSFLVLQSWIEQLIRSFGFLYTMTFMLFAAYTITFLHTYRLMQDMLYFRK